MCFYFNCKGIFCFCFILIFSGLDLSYFFILVEVSYNIFMNDFKYLIMGLFSFLLFSWCMLVMVEFICNIDFGYGFVVNDI